MQLITQLKQRGDTIVEVLIATAVVSIVLTGAMAVSNNSLKQIRAAQERSEAQAYAQATVESLDQFLADIKSSNNTAFVNAIKSDFCIVLNASTRKLEPKIVTADTTSWCTFDRYRQKITPVPNKNNTYEVTVNWDGISGNLEQLNLAYRTSQ